MAETPDEGVISQDVRDASKPDRNLALELVRVTEAGALAAAAGSAAATRRPPTRPRSTRCV